MSHFSRRFAASLAAAAIAGAAFAPGAMAQDTPAPGPFQETAANAVNDSENRLGEIADITNADIAALINGAQTASLTINKYAGVPGSGNTDTPMEGVTFKVHKIEGLDITKLADWQAFAASAAEGKIRFDENGDPILPDGASLGDSDDLVTGADGVGSLTGLDLGFYYVTEVPVPGYTTTPPFMVSLPTTNPNPNNPTVWDYDVVVSPKNEPFKATKEVTDAFAKAGDIITYTLTGSIPSAQSGAGATPLEWVTLVDRTPEYITLQTGDATLQVGTVDDEGEFTPVGTQPAEGDWEVTSNDGDTHFTLKQSYLDNLDSEATDLHMRVVVNALVGEGGMDEADFGDDDAADNGLKLENQVFLFNSLAGGDPNDPTEDDPSAGVDSVFGQIIMNKSSSKAGASKEGAEFELYRCAPLAEDETDADLKTIDGPLMVSGESTWTTDADGVFTISGLQVEDYRDGDNVADDFDYCLVEVTALEGHELLPHPVGASITLSDAVTTVAVTNVPDNGGFTLPRTGEAGNWVLIGVGSLALAGAAGFMARRRFSSEETPAA